MKNRQHETIAPVGERALDRSSIPWTIANVVSYGLPLPMPVAMIPSLAAGGVDYDEYYFPLVVSSTRDSTEFKHLHPSKIRCGRVCCIERCVEQGVKYVMIRKEKEASTLRAMDR